MSAGNTLEGHDSNGAGFLGDAGLFWGDHVHNYAALEHLGVAGFNGKSAGQDLCNHCKRLLSFGGDAVIPL